MEQEWYEKWFDTPFYHLLYESRNDEEAEKFVRNIIEFLAIPANSRVIDIACGRGRHARIMNKYGLNVTGIDLSRKSIEYAQNYACHDLRFKCHDKRQTLENQGFDYAMNLFTSFGYLPDLEQLRETFLNMAKNLKSGGYFIIDFLNAYKVRLEGTDANYEERIEGINFKISKSIVGEKIIKNIDVGTDKKSYQFEEEVYLLELKHFEDFCRFSDLKIKHIFGDYDLNPFDEEKSDRLIIVARKN